MKYTDQLAKTLLEVLGMERQRSYLETAPNELCFHSLGSMQIVKYFSYESSFLKSKL